MKIFVGFFLILTTPAYAQMFENLFHHHLHNFAINDEMAFHAKAMGYSLICESKPDDPLYDDIGLIKLQNARVGPVRIYIEKASGEVHVRYHKRTLLFDSRLHAIADLYGLERIEGKIYPITEDDWFIVKSYSAAVKNVSGLTVDDLDESVFEDCFVKTWTLEDNEYRSFNLAANWQSKKVVNDYVKVLTAETDWRKYGAIFWDSISNRDAENATNKDFGGEGSYPSRREGQFNMIQRISDFCDPAKTGGDGPCFVFCNMYNTSSNNGMEIIKAYSSGTLRFDHYYHEKGGLGTQHANGVVPGTDKPAYIVPGEPQHYLPASRLALDDVYTFNKNMNIYDREEHFQQHLDACGTAGLFGAWFGWYGEDYVTRKDPEGQLIYTNDLQLLRAIPNWDNLADIPVPAFDNPEETDQRSWNGNIYNSSNSFASDKVIYSINPLNDELYVVFKSMDGRVELNGAIIKDADWVDDWFRKMDNALSALQITNDVLKLDSAAEGYLGSGLRLRTEKSTKVNNQLVPRHVVLQPAYPNPFNPGTTISYVLTGPADVSLTVHNLNGQHIETLVNARQTKGRYTKQWNPQGLGSGLYIYKLTAGEYKIMKKCTLLR